MQKSIICTRCPTALFHLVFLCTRPASLLVDEWPLQPILPFSAERSNFWQFSSNHLPLARLMESARFREHSLVALNKALVGMGVSWWATGARVYSFSKRNAASVARPSHAKPGCRPQSYHVASFYGRVWNEVGTKTASAIEAFASKNGSKLGPFHCQNVWPCTVLLLAKIKRNPTPPKGGNRDLHCKSNIINRLAKAANNRFGQLWTSLLRPWRWKWQVRGWIDGEKVWR